MNQVFSYSTQPHIQGPIWSDMSPESDFSKLLIKAKTENDDQFWTHMRKVFDHDFNTLPRDRYKVWMSTFQVPLMSNSKHSIYIKQALNASPDVQMILEEPMIGCNEEDFNRFFRIFSDNNMSMNRMQLYGHLATFGFKPKKYKSILEIGAGAGELADIIFRMGFDGEYSIYDFPELMQMQKWFHEKRNLQVQYLDTPNDLCGKDLVIATWSLTEMPMELRDQIVDGLYEDNTNDWLIAYSNKIFGYDNNDWINNSFIPRFDTKDYEIDLVDIPSMSWDGGTKYLFIKRKIG